MKIYFRAIKPKHSSNPFDAIADEVLKAVDKEVKPALIKYFERIVRKWDHQPQFKAMKRFTALGLSVYVYPTGPNADIWRFVSLGTKRHPIGPKKPGGKLAFPWGGYGSYKPKTSKGGHYNGPGIVTNPVTTILDKVDHPGNEGREFEKHIARWYRPEFKRTIKNAIRRGKRKRR